MLAYIIYVRFELVCGNNWWARAS